MSTFETLLELVKSVFDGELDVTNITPESRLIEDIGMQSIGMLYMAVAIEEKFGIKFNNDDFAKIKTVKDIVARIEGEV
ncbi:MAG: acyl carrier protein [Lachnospiraceae bacterium]|nr:acyl carrier protein [Lachnospiraceae bacterium]